MLCFRSFFADDGRPNTKTEDKAAKNRPFFENFKSEQKIIQKIFIFGYFNS